MYKLTEFSNVIAIASNTCIPFDPANTEYAKFKLDIQGLSVDIDGNKIPPVELQDAEGNAMSSADIQTFLAGLK